MAALVACLLALVVGCSSPASTPATSAAPAAQPAAAREPATREARVSARDLSADEAMGGHTLARHVAKTDADLQERLQREPQISSASTYTDRAAAERVVAAALASAGEKLTAWQNRSGRRPNLVLHYVDRAGEPFGRSLSRGRSASVPSDRAVVVLRWDERADRFYVLTSYPEAKR